MFFHAKESLNQTSEQLKIEFTKNSVLHLLVDVAVAPEEPLAAAGVLHRHILVVRNVWVLLCARWPASATALQLPFLVQEVLVESCAEDCARDRCHPIDLRWVLFQFLNVHYLKHINFVKFLTFSYIVVIPNSKNDCRPETARRVNAAARPGRLLSGKNTWDAIDVNKHHQLECAQHTMPKRMPPTTKAAIRGPWPNCPEMPFSGWRRRRSTHARYTIASSAVPMNSYIQACAIVILSDFLVQMIFPSKSGGVSALQIAAPTIAPAICDGTYRIARAHEMRPFRANEMDSAGFMFLHTAFSYCK